MFKAPNGDEFKTKHIYKCWLESNENRKNHIIKRKRISQRNAYNLGTSRKRKCPKCFRIDYLTRDWKGNLMCSTCFRNSL